MKLNLKLIVASMSMLGLISCPLYAAAQTQHKSKTKHHRVVEHETYKEEGGYKGEEAVYKDEGALPQVCPVVNMYTLYMDAMSQNIGRAKPTVGCDQPIQMAGGINFDTTWGNRFHGFQGEVNDRFALNDAYLTFTGNVNQWVKAFIELSYNNIEEDPLKGAGRSGSFFSSPGPDPLAVTAEPKPGVYSTAYELETLSLQQGVIIIGSPDRFPVYLRVGKQFLDFGRYMIHPITRSFTQVMTETNQTSAELSFISGWNGMAVHGSLFAFQNPMTQGDDELGRTNYGGQVGIGVISDQLGWDVGLGYLYNFTGVNDVAYAVTLFNSGSLDGEGEYDDRVSAVTLYGMVNSGPFSVSAHYVTALQHFDSFDLLAEEDEDDHFFGDDDGDGAKPWSADIQAAYGFNAFDHNQNVYIGYQVSDEAINLWLPESRWMVGYGVDVWKNTNATFEFSRDKDYDEDDGGTNEATYRGVLRVGVKFG